VLLVFPVVLVAVLLPGCVPVTEPLSDPDKAEPDKRLLGKWESPENLEIDSPAVKGNPKGLMRVVYDGDRPPPDDLPPGKNATWFFTTKIGKDTYATIYVEPPPQMFVFADFHKEGAFEKWNKRDDRCYYIVRYVLDGDELAVDVGDKEAVPKLMLAEKIEWMQWFAKTQPGWLATYLEKNGPKTLYQYAGPGFRRSKK
jgi:hypothetical protein